jgi:hypothetical protein
MPTLPGASLHDVLRQTGLYTLEADENGVPPNIDAVKAVLERVGRVVDSLSAIDRISVKSELISVLKRAGISAASQLASQVVSPGTTNMKAGTAGGSSRMTLPEVELWEEPVNGAEVLNEIVATILRYVVIPEDSAVAVALWIAFVHAHDEFAISPILNIGSPEKRCGKTTLLSLISALVPRPLPTSNLTTAVLFRAIDSMQPTLLVDESDTFIDGDHKGELRGVLNSGHTRATAYVLRTAGDNFEPRRFSTWAPKAIAGIGRLTGTLADRSITVELTRRTADQTIERIRLDRLHQQIAPVASRVARWVADNITKFSALDPEVPPSLHDRAADNWRPLLALADVAGGTWPARARHAAERMHGRTRDDDSNAVKLLFDVREIFSRSGAQRLQSAQIVAELSKLEDRPWPEWKGGKPITPNQLSGLLRNFSVSSKKLRFGSDTARGYEREAFLDAFARYLPPLDGTPGTSELADDVSTDDMLEHPSILAGTSEGRRTDVPLVPPVPARKGRLQAMMEEIVTQRTISVPDVFNLERI